MFFTTRRFFTHDNYVSHVKNFWRWTLAEMINASQQCTRSMLLARDTAACCVSRSVPRDGTPPSLFGLAVAMCAQKKVSGYDRTTLEKGKPSAHRMVGQ